jgi:UDPglucose 6-dehydrogenase
MKIMVVGAGYVGLVSAACLAELGHSVTCLDNDPEKIKKLVSGESPIYEPGLEGMLKRNLAAGKLRFTAEGLGSAEPAEVIFITVGTPMSRGGNGYADLSYVFDAARSLAPFLKTYRLVVTKSTVPVGTANRLERAILAVNPRADFDIASNPEFLREGEAIFDFMNPERVIVGTRSGRAEERLRNVYQPLIERGVPFMATDPETAELTKYACNAFLAMKISFMNEVASLCEKVGADVQDVATGMGFDARIGPSFLRPGPGYGGSCFPKDTIALLRTAQEHDAPARILETVVEVNNAQKARMVRKICDALGPEVEGKTLAVWGLTFKPKTDDIREAPALAILPILMENGIKIHAHDPAGMEGARKLLPDVRFFENSEEACRGADAVCLMTEWEEYRTVDLARVKSLLRFPLFIDLRNVFSPEVMKAAGFHYVSIGRRPAGFEESPRVVALRRSRSLS